MESVENIYQKVYVSPRPPPTISYKHNWTCNLDSDVARSSKDIQRIELKPKTRLSSTVRPVTKWSEETLERTKFDRDTLNQEKHDNVTDSTSTARPVCGHEFTERCVLTPEHVERDQTSTGRPVTVDQKEEHNIDFRVPRLSHSVVKEAEHLRVQELVRKIENHPHREALQADLQQNNVYIPFSKNSKEVIREFGNVELFELCETKPKVQCSHCLLYWNQGIVYCIMVLDTARPRYKENTSWLGMCGRDAARKLTLKVDLFAGNHDRFLRDPVYRESQLAIGWTEQKCKE